MTAWGYEFVSPRGHVISSISLSVSLTTKSRLCLLFLVTTKHNKIILRLDPENVGKKQFSAVSLICSEKLN